MEIPVDGVILDALLSNLSDFRRAYDENEMSVDEFDQIGATVRTLRTFISSWHDFVALIREYMLPNPDIAG